MSRSPQKATEAVLHTKRQRRLLLSSGVLAVIACAVVGSYLYRSEAAPYEYVNPVHRISTRAEIARMKQDDIARARLIREKWRPWAEAHQNLLRKMRHGKGNEKILQEFVKTVPGTTPMAKQLKPEDAMQVTSEDLGSVTSGATPFPPEELSRLSRQMFSWMPGSIKGWKEIKWVTREGKPTTPSADFGAGSKFVMNRWRRTFGATGDVELAGASSPMEPQIKFWASGRITSLQKEDGDAQGRLDTPTNNLEIAPAYEFLR